MSIYPVDAPGGYMPIGMIMPSVDIFGTKSGFTKEQPWIFQDMDTVGFYEVTGEEYDAEMMRFKSGSYKYKMEASTFDLAEHNELLKSTAKEVSSLLRICGKLQDEMAIKEKKILQEWLESKAATNVAQDDINTDDPNTHIVESPVNANIWKVLVKDGDFIRAGQKLAILEAMKMEIDICLDAHIEKATIQKVLTQPSVTVASGRPLFVVSKF
ncbi:hypothetical protein COCVIDRAFT_22250 [Bipolaris victoriae FI3]|uniref:Lipoyl-binding domain-containing protein n=1 Tax=Bipolaris victoriae (strain FI3) TaxID=930091 RepID=W7EZS3_BIPV3|nr:hypothetical protein COCVIDRAFT_22250 [Bipolaris victoriae FI3]